MNDTFRTFTTFFILIVLIFESVSAQKIIDRRAVFARWADEIHIDTVEKRVYYGGSFPNIARSPACIGVVPNDSTQYSEVYGRLIGTPNSIYPIDTGGFFLGGRDFIHNFKRVKGLIRVNNDGKYVGTDSLFGDIQHMAKYDSILAISCTNGVYGRLVIYNLKTNTIDSIKNTSKLNGPKTIFLGFDGENLLVGNDSTVWNIDYKTRTLDSALIKVNNELTCGLFYNNKFFIGHETSSTIYNDYGLLSLNKTTLKLDSVYKYDGTPTKLLGYNNRLVVQSEHDSRYRNLNRAHIHIIDARSMNMILPPRRIKINIYDVYLYDSVLWLLGDPRMGPGSSYAHAIDTGTLRYLYDGPKLFAAGDKIVVNDQSICIMDTTDTNYSSGIMLKDYSRFAAFDLETDELIETPAIGGNGSIRKIFADSNLLFLSGYYSSIDTFQKRSVVALDRKTLKPTNVHFEFTDGSNRISAPRVFYKYGNYIYVGGTFSKVNNISVTHLVRINRKTREIDTTWTPDISGNSGGGVHDIAFFNGMIAVCGDVLDNDNRGVMFYNIKNGKKLSRRIKTFGYPTSMIVNGDSLFIMGDFYSINNDTKYRKTALLIARKAGGIQIGDWHTGNTSFEITKIAKAKDLTLCQRTDGLYIFDPKNDIFHPFTPSKNPVNAEWGGGMDFTGNQLAFSASRGRDFINYYKIESPYHITSKTEKRKLCAYTTNDTIFVNLSSKPNPQYTTITCDDTTRIPLQNIDTAWVGNKLALIIKTRGPKSQGITLGLLITENDSIELSFKVSVYTPKPLNISYNEFICEGDTSLISVNSNLKEVYWNNQLGNSDISISNDTTLLVYGIDVNNCATATDTANVNVKIAHKVKFIDSLKSNYCVGDTLKLSVETGKNEYAVWNSVDTTRTFSSTDTSNKVLSLKLYDRVYNCVDSFAAVYNWVKLKTPSITSNLSDTFCIGDSVYIQVQADSVNTFEWLPKNVIGNSYTHNIDSNELLLKYSAHACSDTLSIKFDLGKIPTQNLSGISQCLGDSFKFKINSYYTIDTSFWLDTTVSYSFKSDTNLLIKYGFECKKVDTLKVDVVQNAFKPIIINSGDTLSILNENEALGNIVYWYHNADLIDSFYNKKQFITNMSGNYNVMAIDSNGCKSFSDTVNILPTGVNSKKVGVHIYPNPTNSILHINSEQALNIVRVYAVGLDGKSHVLERVNSGYSVKALKAGAYAIVVVGESTTIKKLLFVTD
ncbi:MAG: hypothetical protein JXQ87_18205 [Bacteroidia bacterium]